MRIMLVYSLIALAILACADTSYGAARLTFLSVEHSHRSWQVDRSFYDELCTASWY